MVNRLFHALAHSNAIGCLTPFLIGQRQIFGGILYFFTRLLPLSSLIIQKENIKLIKNA
jgi:hypothetical protein